MSRPTRALAFERFLAERGLSPHTALTWARRAGWRSPSARAGRLDGRRSRCVHTREPPPQDSTRSRRLAALRALSLPREDRRARGPSKGLPGPKRAAPARTALGAGLRKLVERRPAPRASWVRDRALFRLRTAPLRVGGLAALRVRDWDADPTSCECAARSRAGSFPCPPAKRWRMARCAAGLLAPSSPTGPLSARGVRVILRRRMPSRGSRDRPARTAPLLRHAPPRCGRGPARDPGAARPRAAVHDPALYPCLGRAARARVPERASAGARRGLAWVRSFTGPPSSQ